MSVTLNHTHEIELKSGVQFIEFNHANIAFDYQCSSSNPSHLLVLVNGFQRTRLDFRAFRKKIEKFYPHIATLALDNRFCGETEVEQGISLSMEDMARDVQYLASLFMKKCGLNKASFLGISMGGMIVQTLAALPNVDFIENLFLVSTTCGGVGRTWQKSVTDPSLLRYEDKNIDLESTKKNMSRYFADRFLKNSPLLFEMMCKNIVSSAQNLKAENENAKTQFYASVLFDGSPHLSSIKAKKTVVITGDEDRIIPYENSVYLHEHIPNSSHIVYAQVGHLILIEEPERFVQDVSSFFIPG
jgi:pimeloyl-ACP methyl ester carboxylesterase